MLEAKQPDLYSTLGRLTGEPFGELFSPVLSISLGTGPRWSNPEPILLKFKNLTGKTRAQLITSVPTETGNFEELLSQVEETFEIFLHSPQRSEGVIIYASARPRLIEFIPFSITFPEFCFYDRSLHLDLFFPEIDKDQIKITHWVHRERVNQRLIDPLFIQRLGYGSLELQRGNWFSNADIAAFARVVPNSHHYAGLLLLWLDKRFPDLLAEKIWHEITGYARQKGILDQPEPFLKNLAREWFSLYGLKVIKDWYFSPNCPQRHYLQGGHEWEPGPLTGFLLRWEPVLEVFGQAGFDLGKILGIILEHPGYILRNWKSLDLGFWIWFVANLNNLELSPKQINLAFGEISYLQASGASLTSGLKTRKEICGTVLDYFKRLDLAGLGPEAIGV